MNFKTSLAKHVGWVLASLLIFGFNHSKAQTLDAYFYHAPFYAPGIGTYVETYIAIPGHNVHYMYNSDSVLQASINVTMLFKNGDEIKEFRKYNFLSPAVTDTNAGFPTFIDLQRIPIKEGIYNFKLILTDNFAIGKPEPFVIHDLVSINIPEKELSFSGIEFLESYLESKNENIFIKNGFECVPYVSDYFGEKVNQLRFYFELYNCDLEMGPGADFLITYNIENSNTKKPIQAFSSFQKQPARNINPVFKTIDISKLGTGNYYLTIEVRNRENVVVASTRKFFQRYNPISVENNVNYSQIKVETTFAKKYNNVDTLALILNSLRPICDVSEQRFIDNQLKSKDLQLMQQFFFGFWQKRNETNPQYAWELYREQLIYVQTKYGSKYLAGFSTDRGRVYLQYGPPNTIIEERSESNAYPYEIWHYYKIADLSNKKFLFYNKNLMDNDYELLYSNMTGEASNPNWEAELYSRTDGFQSTIKNNEKNKAVKYFEGE